MRAIHGPTMGGAWVLTAILVATACHSDPRPRSPGLERQLREVALTAERDSLIMEVAANGRLLNDIQAELTRVQPAAKVPGTPESPSLELTKDQRAYVLDQIRGITGRLKAVETKLAVSERRARRLALAGDSLKQANGAARESIVYLTDIVENQKATITALNSQIEGLVTENLTLADSVFRLTDRHNTAYFVVGTRDELLAKGVLVEGGHRAFPLVGRRSVQPARDLPLGEFTSIDRSTVRQIPLPRADRQYRIISRQNLASLEDQGDRDRQGRVTGAISIREPEEFWEPSRYLIVVEQ